MSCARDENLAPGVSTPVALPEWHPFRLGTTKQREGHELAGTGYGLTKRNETRSMQLIAIIDRIPSPLLDDIVQGRCVPIVGAGFSRNAILPSGLSMPLWRELGNLIG